MPGRNSTIIPCRIGILVCLTLSALVLGTAPLPAQSVNTKNTLRLDDPASRPEATVDSLHWLAGLWQGESSIGSAEEIWAPPSSGTLVGAFKVVQKDEERPYFYELMEISEEEGSLTFKVKHFSAELHGWEEKDDFVSFPLVKLGLNEAYFDGLTYRRTGNELRTYVAIAQKDGSIEELEFVFERQKQ